jgi:hypothetical protein
MDSCTLDSSTSSYVRETFALITRLRGLILRISDRIGVPPVAVAGAIADEYNARVTELSGFRRYLDESQDQLWSWLPEYIFDWSVRHASSSKVMNATRHDIGDGNINVATARTVYDEFRSCFVDIPTDTSPFVGEQRDRWNEIVDYVLTSEGTVVLAALVIKKAMREMAPQLRGRSPEIQEAILVTYYKQGARYVQRFYARLAENSDATLIPGEGCRVYHQRAEFMRALGLPVPAANQLPAAPSCW